MSDPHLTGFYLDKIDTTALRQQRDRLLDLVHASVMGTTDEHVAGVIALLDTMLDLAEHHEQLVVSPREVEALQLLKGLESVAHHANDCEVQSAPRTTKDLIRGCPCGLDQMRTQVRTFLAKELTPKQKLEREQWRAEFGKGG